MANPLTKEAGGQPVWAWGAEILGALGVFVWWRRRQATNAATAATGIPTSVGPPGVLTGGGTSSTPTAPNTWAQWLQQALAAATGPNYGPTAAYNDFTQWIQGGCTSATGANAIGNAISTLGLPPGFGSGLPAITVCSSNSTTGTSSGGSNPPTSGSSSGGGGGGTGATGGGGGGTSGPAPVIPTTPITPVKPLPATAPWTIGQTVSSAGETIVDIAENPGGGYYGLTNYGGVYTSGAARLSSAYGGSYLGYLNTLSPSLQKTNTPGGPGTGLGNFSGGSIVVTSPGHYTLTDNTGHTYAF